MTARALDRGHQCQTLTHAASARGIDHRENGTASAKKKEWPVFTVAAVNASASAGMRMTKRGQPTTIDQNSWPAVSLHPDSRTPGSAL